MPVYHGQGDAIEGKRISCQFRKSKKEKIIRGTGAHRARALVLYEAYCVIVKPFRFKK